MATRTRPPTTSIRLPKTEPRLAEVKPRGGEGARDEPDHDTGVDDPPVAEHTEADPHRKRVDAGRHRQDDEGDSPRGVLPAVPLLPASPTPFVYHLPADIAEQDEGEPVIVSLDVPLHGHPGKVPDHGHEKLEQPEVEGQAEGLPAGHRPQDDSRGDRHGEGVHGQSHRDGEKRQRVDRNLRGRVTI